MQKLIWLLSIVGITTQLTGQNLIPNPGFEQCAKCDSRGFKELGIGSGANDPIDWNAATYGSPDFYSITPHSGKKHGGFFVGFPKFEYLLNHFTECLKPGAKYQFSFWVRPSTQNLNYIIDEIGVYILSGSGIHPQAEPLKQIVPTFQSNDGDFITQAGYRQFSFDYTAQGGEDHFIVGRFRALGSGDTTFVGTKRPVNPSGEPIYYFVDDFSMIEISPPQVDLIPDIVSIPCEGDQTSISIPFPYNKGNITWSTGETTETIVLSKPGNIVVTIALNDSCHTTLRDSTLVVISHTNPSLEIMGPDKICYGKTIELTAICDLCLGYTWSTKETTDKITISKEGVYTLMAITACDTIFQTKKIESSNVLLDSLIRFPNIFSPDGEEINRKFRPWIHEMKKDSIISLNLYVYNRWGKTLYEKKDINAAWIPDADVPMETYIYVCELEYKDCDGPKKEKLKGTVTLVR